MTPNKAVTAVILCGGAGERMGGVDKPLRPLLGKTLLQWVLDRVRPQVDNILLVANRSAEIYAAYGAVVDDGVFAGLGPLAGVAAGLAAAVDDQVLCVPGDAPWLPQDLLARLRQARRRDDAEAAVVHDGGGLQPLCNLLPRSLLPSLSAYLAEGKDVPRYWLMQQRTATADCSDWPRWGWSLNTPEEWAEAERRLQKMEQQQQP
jgi:molybdopterin-guanine dinucleotide biosynthesis protein A